MFEMVMEYWPHVVAVGTTLLAVLSYLKMAQEIDKLRLERRKINLELKKLERELIKAPDDSNLVKVASVQETLLIMNGSSPAKTVTKLYKNWSKEHGTFHGVGQNPWDVLDNFNLPFMDSLKIPLFILLGFIPILEPNNSRIILWIWLIVSMPVAIQSARREVYRFYIQYGEKCLTS